MKTMKLLVVVILAVGGLVMGCSNQEEEQLRSQIGDQINLLDKQVKEMDAHQQNLRAMIGEMRTQLETMQAELDKETPRIEAANKAMLSLRELTTVGFGDSPLVATAKDPSWSVLWVLLFVFLLWLFYRLKTKAAPQS